MCGRCRHGGEHEYEKMRGAEIRGDLNGNFRKQEESAWDIRGAIEERGSQEMQMGSSQGRLQGDNRGPWKLLSPVVCIVVKRAHFRRGGDPEVAPRWPLEKAVVLA